ncbi:unnamed protein product [Cylindrotheca closterium]|uniref:Uncharacterized protein n=1 Tax=Cylindrotheca closterium TaxID=2856 RepID=A0AAD2G1G8_9STRA|nr:unnamed protein product [Cylindrotheca closterium]
MAPMPIQKLFLELWRRLFAAKQQLVKPITQPFASVNSRSVSLAPVEVVQAAVPQQGVEVEAVVAAQNLMPALPLAPEQPQQPQQPQQPPQPPQSPQQPTTPPNQPEEHNNHTRSVPDEQQAPEPMTMGQQSVLLTPPAQQQQGPQPVATQHGFEWFDEPDGVSIGNLIRQREWLLRTPVNDEICDGCDAGFLLPRLDYFLLLFPSRAFSLILMVWHWRSLDQ